MPETDAAEPEVAVAKNNDDDEDEDEKPAEVNEESAACEYIVAKDTESDVVEGLGAAVENE